MERNSTACAMEWSIEFEMTLRSKNPGRRIEAILQIGQRLEQWNGEPESTMIMYNMFGLVPGEERLFASTIFLRVADAFLLGDKHIRVSIVKLFLSLLRNRRDKKKSKRIKGIFAKSRVHNHLELLKRVKFVYDTGDVESRALALVLFGCWADFAKDSAQIRHLVLSSLVSSNVSEVRASLFAAGCFSEIADDFASVVLEILVNIVTYSETVSAVRLAAVRIFAKMGCSYSIANRAYKTGLKLVLDSSGEDFLVAMLVSISKLACKSTLLISEQLKGFFYMYSTVYFSLSSLQKVDFLLSVLSCDKTLCVRATALRCLHLIFVRGMCHSLINATVIKALFSMIDEPGLPSTMQCEALQILRQIFLCASPNDLSCLDMHEFGELLAIVDNASQSPIASKSFRAIEVLVNIVIKFRRTEMGSGGVCTLPLPSQVVSLIIEPITLLVKPFLDLSQFNSTVFQEVRSLLNLLLLLGGEHPDLGILVLDKVHLFIEHLVNSYNNVTVLSQASSAAVEFKDEQNKAITSKLVCIINRIVVSCLISLNEASAITNQVFDKVKLLVECVRRCSLFDCYTHTVYSLLLHSYLIWGCMVNRNEEIGGVDRNSHIFGQNYLIMHELNSLEFAHRMLLQRDNWPAYKAGIHAVCHGAWISADFIFAQLVMKVQSDCCCCWLKSLSQWVYSERIIQLLLLPKHGSISLNCLEIKEFLIMLPRDDLCELGQDVVGNTNEPDYSQALVVAHRMLCSAGNTLETNFTSGKTFCFQRWFLALRAKVLEALVEIFRALSAFPYKKDNIQVGEGMMVESLKFLKQITQISFQLRRLSQEFDLMATSFIGMDSKSSKIIKTLALSCSLLAVCTGFALYIPSLPAIETLTTCGLESSQNCSPMILIQNLVGRLWNLDRETCTNLCMLLETSGQSQNCFHLQSRNQLLNMGCEVKDIVDACRYAVSGIVCLQNEANKVHNDEILSQVTKNGLQLLSKVIFKWIRIPFQAPKYFFRVRPCVGSELFVSDADTRSQDRILVLKGSHLSLNLCLQLKNMPPDLLAQLTKFYCILYCVQKPASDGQNMEQALSTWLAWESTDMVEMNGRLFQYVTECSKKTNYGKRSRDNDICKDGKLATAFADFELNERGQGFSNCLLDVSKFPVGTYRIKWHSCCMDSQGSYWSLLPLNAEPVINIRR
ncbi:hypothetical protein Dsin_028583 [Dipteronia sinensis]|uniref:Integrator complex subunit 7 n=1 Tax=Dipteronia sinensis TaxID=43782 RepID=A0AAD9ZS34_9ROSI|nr:hypothetical protein Dsin_028583 [Dipteronia sinensis]